MNAITETLEVSRSNQYEKTKKPRQHYRKAGDDGYLALIRQITDDRPTYGYRRAAAILNRILEEQGEPRVNHKRVYLSDHEDEQSSPPAPYRKTFETPRRHGHKTPEQ